MSCLHLFESAHSRKNAYFLLPLYIIGLKIVPRDIQTIYLWVLNGKCIIFINDWFYGFTIIDAYHGFRFSHPCHNDHQGSCYWYAIFPPWLNICNQMTTALHSFNQLMLTQLLSKNGKHLYESIQPINSSIIKVLGWHIFETAIKMLFVIWSQRNFVCMFLKAFWTPPLNLRGEKNSKKILFLKLVWNFAR